MQTSEAKSRFLDVAFSNNTRAVANFEALVTLAQLLYQAENVGFKIDPDSVEKAVKNILGVD